MNYIESNLSQSEAQHKNQIQIPNMQQHEFLKKLTFVTGIVSIAFMNKCHEPSALRDRLQRASARTDHQMS